MACRVRPQLHGRSVKEREDHGTERKIDGNFKPGSTVIVIDDVTTKGGSVMQAVRAVRACARSSRWSTGWKARARTSGKRGSSGSRFIRRGSYWGEGELAKLRIVDATVSYPRGFGMKPSSR
jgi:hypothetical protein